MAVSHPEGGLTPRKPKRDANVSNLRVDRFTEKQEAAPINLNALSARVFHHMNVLLDQLERDQDVSARENVAALSMEIRGLYTLWSITKNNNETTNAGSTARNIRPCSKPMMLMGEQ
jgi:hypothetical protein